MLMARCVTRHQQFGSDIHARFLTDIHFNPTRWYYKVLIIRLVVDDSIEIYLIITLRQLLVACYCLGKLFHLEGKHIFNSLISALNKHPLCLIPISISDQSHPSITPNS